MWGRHSGWVYRSSRLPGADCPPHSGYFLHCVRQLSRTWREFREGEHCLLPCCSLQGCNQQYYRWKVTGEHLLEKRWNDTWWCFLKVTAEFFSWYYFLKCSFSLSAGNVPSVKVFRNKIWYQFISLLKAWLWVFSPLSLLMYSLLSSPRNGNCMQSDQLDPVTRLSLFIYIKKTSHRYFSILWY